MVTGTMQQSQSKNDEPPRRKPKNRARVADMRWLLGFISNHRLAAAGAIISGMIGGVTLTLEPYLIGVIIDHIRAGVDMAQITEDVLTLIGFSIVTVIAFFGQRTFSGKVAYEVHYDIRKTVFDNMVTLDQGFYRRYPTGDLISRMFSDLNWVWRLLALGFNRGGSAIVVAIFAFILLATVDLTLTIIVFVILAFATAFQIRAGLVLTRISQEVQDQAGELSALVQDSTTGIQTIKTFGREEDVHSKFYKENREYRRRWLYFKRRNEPVGMLPQMFIQLTTGVVVIIGGARAIEGSMTLGNFAQFVLYLNLIRQVLLQIGTIYQRFMQTRGALQRVTPLLQKADIHDAPHAVTLDQPRGEFTFDNVNYFEGDKQLLKDINLHVESGAVVAIVGPTGCGKTLLVNLLARVMDPTSGTVKVDGIDVRNIQLDNLRQAIAYVPQLTFLFSQPLHENVRMGKPDISDFDLMQAIHISRVTNDLPHMPDGLDTMVGEKGVMLSGGQKQRVAIARAVARDPSILVLDDALSSVDTQTAAEILGEMRQVLKTRTSIIIAHRIATVKDADRIIVMDEGSIVEEGTHDELIKLGGHYAGMVERELSEEREMI